MNEDPTSTVPNHTLPRGRVVCCHVSRGVDLISDELLFGRLWYAKAPDAVDYAKFYSRSADAVIRVAMKNFRVCDRDQPPSTLILDSKIPPILAVRAA